MPGWHRKTLELQKTGKIRVVAIIEEQHPDRCRLFNEWKRMDWPVMVDALNLLGVRAVPFAYLVDEHGVIRKARPAPDDVASFVATEFPKPAGLPPPTPRPSLAPLPASAGVAASIQRANALFHTGDAKQLAEAIRLWTAAQRQKERPDLWFRLGVAYRRRHESPRREAGDFQRALECWGKALDAVPGQYIWRRRIQQYGPRLEKPYAFYDWVDKARGDIRARGDTPPRLRVEPGAAEIAGRSRTFGVATEGKLEEPDARDRLPLDRDGLVRIETAIAPVRVVPGKSARVHVELRPSASKKAHWNNEAGQLVLWLRPPKGVEVDRRYVTARNATEAASSETRRLEFEVRVAKNVPADRPLEIPAYAVYFVCEDVGGVCMFLRQDLRVKIPVTPTAKR